MTPVSSETLFLGFLGFLCLERLAELAVSSRNARRALASGGVESGRRHYAVMVVVHALFPFAAAGEVLGLGRPFPGAAGWTALALALAAQALRWWAIATLGPRWSTRVVVVPGAAPVTSGPYRFVRHPNYLAVVLEMAAVPSVHGAWLTAVVFSAANAALLAVRVPAEERALGAEYARALGRLPRFVPGASRG